MESNASLHNAISKIEYDLLGNPKKVSFANRSYIDYVYSADGRRLRTRHFTAVPSSTPLPLDQASTLTSSQILSVDSTEYIGSFVFENNAFKQYLFDGGYITPSAFQPCKYYIKDHLGNNRILASHNGIVEQTTHYYPFGATHHLSTSQGVQKYKYNGKELDTMHGLNWYDYGARQYDPAIGQFTSMDPLCEKYYHLSPYSYCGGNPVNRVDPDGRDIYEFSKTGEMTIKPDNTEDKLIVHNPTKYNMDSDADYGKSVWELSLPLGTINSKTSSEKNGYTILEIDGDSFGKTIFEFLSIATDAEWSQAKTGKDETGVNILTSSHEVDTESGMRNYLLSDGKSKHIRELNHSHPNKHTEPSGKNDGTKDIQFGRYFLKEHPEIQSFNIYVPYTVSTGNYYNFTNYLKP